MLVTSPDLSIYLSIDRSIDLYRSIYRSIDLSIYRSIYLSTYIYIYVCVYVCVILHLRHCEQHKNFCQHMLNLFKHAVKTHRMFQTRIAPESCPLWRFFRSEVSSNQLSTLEKGPCCLCRCRGKGPNTWMDFRDNAPWRDLQ